ncbi:MAG: 3-dehydroquinate synthase [Clostridia bacterium]|nr:3-dehydroquinate synthase [Clostridia bacterium]
MNLSIRRADAEVEIFLGRGLLKKAGELFDLSRKVLLVTDSGIPRDYVQTILSQCKDPMLVTVPAGEENKNFSTYEMLLQACLAADLTRGDCIVALGGGMVGDLAGFSAATYLRGIDFYNIPTSLLAMVDASIGGKTGLDFGGYKNQVGAFYQPKAILCDPDLLDTLPERQLACGYAEVIKMALTLDKDLFYRIESGDAPTEELIRRAIECKASVVAKDERDTDLRRVLNFGHTLGHGIESAAKGSLLHGECVSLGMIPMCAEPVQKRLVSVLEKYRLPTRYEGAIEPVLSAALHDKKRAGDTLTVVFVNEPGNYELKKLSFSDWKKEVRRAPIFS